MLSVMGARKSKQSGQSDLSGRWQAVGQAFFAPVDIASLVFFRVAFGFIIVWEVVKYLATNSVQYHFLAPPYLFKYYFFPWVEPLAPFSMYLLFFGMGLLGLAIATGFMYRTSVALFFLAFTYTMLLDKGRYLNHFYLIALISFLMIFVPANRAWSADTRLWPKLKRDTAPAWTLWLIRAQVAVVYIWGGIHKTNPDWLRGQPMRFFLESTADRVPEWFGRLLTLDTTVFAFAYGGLLLDLFVVPFLLWRPTRVPAFVAALSFHLMNAFIFNIGIFPWFMICATLMYFPPSWPRTVARFFRKEKPYRVDSAADAREAYWRKPGAVSGRRRTVLAFIAVWFTFQALWPTRPYLLVDEFWLWNDVHNRFSWNMMLVDKKVDVHYLVVDPHSGQRWQVTPDEYISRFQYKFGLQSPDMIHQLALHIADEWRRAGFADVQVYARTVASLNGRKPQPLVDPDTDLTQFSRSFGRVPFIAPLLQQDAPRVPWDGELTEDDMEEYRRERDRLRQEEEMANRDD